MKNLLPLLAIFSGIMVISTKNAIISVFNLIVLYILVAFYLIYIGMVYMGLSYIIIYIGAIAILFLFIIMMIDIEVVDKRNNNYLPLLFLLLGGFLITLKEILSYIGIIKMKSLSFKEKKIFDDKNEHLFNLNNNSMYETNPNFVNKSSLLDKNINSLYSNDIKVDNSNNIKLDNLDFFHLGKEYENINISIDNININEIKELSSQVWEKEDFSQLLLKESKEISDDYLLISPNWDIMVNKITQVTSVGDVLYSVYHSYIYLVSIILLLALVGAIILTGEKSQEVRIINIVSSVNNRKSGFSLSLNWLYIGKKNIINFIYSEYKKMKIFIVKHENTKLALSITSFFSVSSLENIHAENIMGNLLYFIIASVILALLLLLINIFFSVNVKYLDKEGGFECGFTSFVQTRERFNVLFYRVALLFLVFDLEIVLVFPYFASYQKNQNISKNNVIIFLYILVIGFIYELKEGALNIVKKAHGTELNIKN
jgi:NADH:ubiquinone oxidoreductase subunit 3 (subunit A)/NADH:ubiquinone oxidoreductase subunit 6 (subunit J)